MPTWSIHPYILVYLVLEGTLQTIKTGMKHHSSYKTFDLILSCLQDMLGQGGSALVGVTNQCLIAFDGTNIHHCLVSKNPRVERSMPREK